MPHKHRNRFPVLLLVLLLSILNAYAIPHSVQEDSTTTSVFETLESESTLSTTQDVDRYFDQTSPSSTPSLTIPRPLATNESASLWTNDTPPIFKVIGHYSERFNNMDVDGMVSQVVTNDTMLLEQTARIPLDPDTIQRDLELNTNDNSQAEELTRQIRESINAEQSKSSADEIKGLRIALTYLIMAAVVVVVIFTRR
jgi:hypothetical protein